MSNESENSLRCTDNKRREEYDELETFSSSSAEGTEETRSRRIDTKVKDIPNKKKHQNCLYSNFKKFMKTFSEDDPNNPYDITLVYQCINILRQLFKTRPLMLKCSEDCQTRTSEYSLSVSPSLSGLRFKECCIEDLETVSELFINALKFINFSNIPKEINLPLTSNFSSWSRYDEDFEEISVLGSGGFGAVFKARHKLDGQEYAIKKINLSRFHLSEHDLILKEVILLSKMSHPNVAKYSNSWIQWGIIPSNDVYEDDYSYISSSNDTASSRSSFKEKQEFSDNDVVFEENVSDCILFEDNENSIGVVLEESEVSNDIFVEKKYSKSSRNKSSSRNCDNSAELCLTPFRSHNSSYGRLLFIQMELGNESLLDWINKRNTKVYNDEYNFNEIELQNHVRIFKEIMFAVEYIHSKGIIHRDIKPANIILKSDNGRILLADFGLAEVFLEKDKSKIGSDVGTPPYAAPEIAERKRYNCKVDIYSLGIILFELMQPFFSGTERAMAITALKDEQQINSYLKEKWENLTKLLLQMIEKDPELRPTASMILFEIKRENKNLNLPSKVTSKFRSNSDPGLSRNSSTNDEIPIVDNQFFQAILKVFKIAESKKSVKLVRIYKGQNYGHKLKGKNLEIRKLKSKINDLELRIEKLELELKNLHT